MWMWKARSLHVFMCQHLKSKRVPWLKRKRKTHTRVAEWIVVALLLLWIHTICSPLCFRWKAVAAFVHNCLFLFRRQTRLNVKANQPICTLSAKTTGCIFIEAAQPNMPVDSHTFSCWVDRPFKNSQEMCGESLNSVNPHCVLDDSLAAQCLYLEPKAFQLGTKTLGVWTLPPICCLPPMWSKPTPPICSKVCAGKQHSRR